jgi:hypothetical protein
MKRQLIKWLRKTKLVKSKPEVDKMEKLENPINASVTVTSESVATNFLVDSRINRALDVFEVKFDTDLDEIEEAMETNINFSLHNFASILSWDESEETFSALLYELPLN